MSWPLPADAVLALFASQPLPGRGHPLLADRLGPAGVAELHSALLFDSLELWGSDRFLAAGGRRVVVFDPPEAGPWFDERTPPSFALQPQSPGGFGPGLASFLQGEIEEGARRVVVLSPFCPTIDPSLVVSAFLCLEQKDVVLGPSATGGCYLIGMRAPAALGLESIDWSRADSLERAVDLIAAAGRSLAVLPPWYEVASLDGLATLSGHLAALRATGMNPALPRTESCLARLAPLAGS